MLDQGLLDTARGDIVARRPDVIGRDGGHGLEEVHCRGRDVGAGDDVPAGTGGDDRASGWRGGALEGPAPVGIYAVASKYAELLRLQALAVTWVD